jgi:hypothetical protein
MALSERLSGKWFLVPSISSNPFNEVWLFTTSLVTCGFTLIYISKCLPICNFLLTPEGVCQSFLCDYINKPDPGLIIRQQHLLYMSMLGYFNYIWEKGVILGGIHHCVRYKKQIWWRPGLPPKWHPIPFIVHCFWLGPIGLWSKAVHYVGNRVPPGTKPWWRPGPLSRKRLGVRVLI